MTDAAPERITASPSSMNGWALGYCTSEPLVAQAASQPVEYVRADLASAAVRRAEALAEAESDALTAAQARIAELEAELEEAKEALTIVTWNRDKLIESLGLEVIEDAQLNAIADERAGGPTVSVKLEDL